MQKFKFKIVAAMVSIANALFAAFVFQFQKFNQLINWEIKQFNNKQVKTIIQLFVTVIGMACCAPLNARKVS